MKVNNPGRKNIKGDNYLCRMFDMGGTPPGKKEDKLLKNKTKKQRISISEDLLVVRTSNVC